MGFAPPQLYNRAANTGASAIIHKNSARAALVSRILPVPAIQRGATMASVLTNETTGTAFLSPEELTAILRSIPQQPQPLPSLPPPGPFPSKAFFSPSAPPPTVTDIQFQFGEQVGTSNIAALTYSMSYVVPSAVYAERYTLSVRDSCNAPLYNTWQQINSTYLQVDLSNIDATKNAVYTNVTAKNNFGASTNRLVLIDPYTTPVLSNAIITYNTFNNMSYFQIQNIVESSFFATTVSNVGNTYVESFNTATSNNTYYVNISNLVYNTMYDVSIFTRNFRSSTTLTATLSIPNYSYSNSDILRLARMIASNSLVPTGLQSSYQINIGGETFGFDYYKSPLYTPITLDSVSNAPATFFTNTADSNSAWIVFNSNVIVPSDVLFIPPVRKLFTVIYVKGDLYVDGIITMTARGASTGSQGGQPIYITTDTNPITIPAAGGSGAPVNTTTRTAKTGSNGIGLQSGGGGGGYLIRNGTSGGVGSGAAGTSFSGGSASGGNYSNTTFTGNAAPYGGGGTAGRSLQNGLKAGLKAGGGAGNPGGNGTQGGASGSPGTGGTLIVIVEGMIAGNGRITSEGSSGGSGTAGGGGSGGGIVTVFYGGRSNTYPTLLTTGGNGGGTTGGRGGSGSSNYIELSNPI